MSCMALFLRHIVACSLVSRPRPAFTCICCLSNVLMCTVIIAGSLLVVPLHHQLDGRAHSEGCDTVLCLCWGETESPLSQHTVLKGRVRSRGRGEEGEGRGRTGKREGRERKEKGKIYMVRLSELVDERLHHAHSANTAQLKIFAGLLRIFDSFHALTVSASSQSYTCKLLHSQGKRSSKYM